ncbi:hypothetical protein EBL_c04790 [Shimwellia blattae DSM 4481 = NBRC 105725]|uniref:Uncharacterized protein n=1 Tax=Shimwellia blattae (strain ATCC 29907 / DSM 4481 / JCM 1650 / NBRC 105725 / CDC 9005-74) TaxID=630626 RepID=I2B501_SHIBC|nr:hypothetical protein EBL_c04790 [Shimwellia blattae DSM 4481 = NBRC 105725]
MTAYCARINKINIYVIIIRAINVYLIFEYGED